MLSLFLTGTWEGKQKKGSLSISSLPGVWLGWSEPQGMKWARLRAWESLKLGEEGPKSREKETGKWGRQTLQPFTGRPQFSSMSRLKPWPLNLRTHPCSTLLALTLRGLRGTWYPAIHTMVLRASPATLLEMLSPRPHPRDMGSEPASSQDPRWLFVHSSLSCALHNPWSLSTLCLCLLRSHFISPVLRTKSWDRTAWQISHPTMLHGIIFKECTVFLLVGKPQCL